MDDPKCPASKKDLRPTWSTGCKGTKAKGVWHNMADFFNSEWAQERDNITNKILKTDVRRMYGKTLAISSTFGCDDINAINFNPYRTHEPVCTQMQKLEKAALHVSGTPEKASKIPCQACLWPPRKGPTNETKCSVTCSCSKGGVASPYGKYSAKGYTGCPGVVPCDPVDSVAQTHDWCVTMHGALSCLCAHQITKTSEAAGKYVKAHPKTALCPLTVEAADEIHKEANLQWGVCKVAITTCKGFTFGLLKSCEEKAQKATLLERFTSLDQDDNGGITALEMYQALSQVHGHARPLDDLQKWVKVHDTDSDGQLSLVEYRA